MIECSILKLKTNPDFISEMMVFNQGKILFKQVLYILDRFSETEGLEGCLANDRFVLYVCVR